MLSVLSALLATACIDALPPGAQPEPDQSISLDFGPPRLDRGRDGDLDGRPERPRPTDAHLRPPGDGPGDDDRPGDPTLDARVPDGPSPDLGQGRDADVIRDARPNNCNGGELCNGLDDDCDGRIDEGPTAEHAGACGPYIARNCRIWLGFSSVERSPGAQSEAWGLCPDRPRDALGDQRCASSAGDGRFHTLPLPARLDDLDEDSQLGVRFDCEPDVVGDWVERHCEVALGARAGPGSPELRDADPAHCGLDAVDGDRLACTRTGGDRRFHRLGFRSDVNEHTRLGTAFWCTDPDDPQRARHTERAVRVFLGVWPRRTQEDSCSDRAIEVSDTWGACPDATASDADDVRCTSARGGDGFGVLRPETTVDACDLLSLSLQINTPEP